MVLFAALFALLTYKFSIGQDPSTADAASEPAPVRKVIERRVITTVVPSASEPPPASATTTSAPVSEVASSGSPPVTTSAS